MSPCYSSCFTFSLMMLTDESARSLQRLMFRSLSRVSVSSNERRGQGRGTETDEESGTS